MKDKIALGGSLLAAIAASLCCIGPLVAVVMGAGAFGAAAVFEAVRPYLLGLTGLLLASAFYLVYRKREAQCEDGLCNVQGASRASKVMLWLTTVGVIAFVLFPYYSGALLKAHTQDKPPAARLNTSAHAANSIKAVTVVSVSGMTCDSCAHQVHSALAKVPGVKSADVSYEQGRAAVIYDPSATSPDVIRSAIDASGYKAGEAVGEPPCHPGRTL